MARPSPYPKKIDIKEKIYYHYKINPSCYSLFDSELSTPVAYGSYNFVSATISKLPETTMIFYYEVDKLTGWKMKRRYNPKNEIVETEESRTTVQKIEEKKKDLT